MWVLGVGGEGGIRTRVPVLPDHPISSRRRYDHFGTSPQPRSCLGAVGRTRTADLLITNQLLYQLSYNGKELYYIATVGADATICPAPFARVLVRSSS